MDAVLTVNLAWCLSERHSALSPKYDGANPVAERLTNHRLDLRLLPVSAGRSLIHSIAIRPASMITLFMTLSSGLRPHVVALSDHSKMNGSVCQQRLADLLAELDIGTDGSYDQSS